MGNQHGVVVKTHFGVVVKDGGRQSGELGLVAATR